MVITEALLTSVYPFNRKLMSKYSPKSSLSLSSGSNCTCYDMQNNVSSSNTVAQSPNPIMLDGVWANHTSKPTKPTRPAYSNALIFKLRSHGGYNKPPVESEYYAQSRLRIPAGIFLAGESPPTNVLGYPSQPRKSPPLKSTYKHR